MSKGKINKMIPFSSVDGLGNRFAIFLQNCMFNCWYCHNPETINNCNNCGICIDYCKTGAISLVEGKVVYDIFKCINCDECIKSCPHNASPKIQVLTPDEVMKEVLKVKPFIRGITVSGGECTLQEDFLIELFTLAQAQGLTCFIDTNGGVPLWDKPELMEVTDKFMLDVKAFDDSEHRKLTGASSENVIKNLMFLANDKKLYEVRTVCSEIGFDNEHTVREVSKILSSIDSSVQYKLITYRPFGVREEFKYKLQVPSESYMQRLSQIVKENGLKNILIV
ncbi:MAG: glycine radical enzyme activase [Bacillales bacterium]|jgi:YjjW family glycine radical enzyme activase|nr:glycine radical enzyme activase [Bacillales bacterium]